MENTNLKLIPENIPATINAAGIDTVTIIIIAVCGVILIIILIIAYFYCKKRDKAKVEDNQQIEINIKQKDEITNAVDKDKPKGKNFIKLEPINNKNNFKDENYEVENLDSESTPTPSRNKNPKELPQNYAGLNDKSISMSISERKLLNDMSNVSKVEIGMKDSYRLGITDRDNSINNYNNDILNNNENNFEASFRMDLSKLDTKQDKIKYLIENNINNINNVDNPSDLFNDISSPHKYHESKEAEKTSKDIIAQNICNYTSGNREEMYSEANSIEDNEDGDDAEVDYNSNNSYAKRNSNNSYRFSLGTNAGEKNENIENVDNTPNNMMMDGISFKNKETNFINKESPEATKSTARNSKYNTGKDFEQDMTPEEHSDFMDDEEGVADANKDVGDLGDDY
jgi:hypothetical protein